MSASAQIESTTSVDASMAKGRLGPYSGLFLALRAKHPPTAAHCLRVALLCSRWASFRGIPEPRITLLETGGLLHDVGKIGIPDSVLQKPAALSESESSLMDMNRVLAAELLAGAGACEDLLGIVCGGKRSESVAVEHAMLSIADAYDSMTSEQVFRRAMSRESAFEELFSEAGHQFNAELVADFFELMKQARPELDSVTASRWVQQFVPEQVAGFVSNRMTVSSGAESSLVEGVFQPKLLNSMSEAVVFLDGQQNVLVWNRAAEELTGIDATAVRHMNWSPDLIGLTLPGGEALREKDDPLHQMLQTNTRTSKSLMLETNDGRAKSVRLTALPVVFRGSSAGSILLLSDASKEARLQREVETLNDMATRDPLTKVSNRTYLGMYLPGFVQEHLESDQPGSAIICDIDYFKKINDTYGHQAGDEALVTFAGVLQSTARESDVIARYGGEEFVIICPGCTNSAATARAEEMRRAVMETPVPALGGGTMTASFGVTELQRGDTSELLLARADRALLQAKEEGRNRVIEVGAGIRSDDATQIINVKDLDLTPRKNSTWMSWFRGEKVSKLTERQLLANVPRDIVLQKLAGFIHDYKADLAESSEDHVAVKVDMSKGVSGWHKGERPAVLLVEIHVTPVEFRTARDTYQSKTLLDVTISPVRSRDRRQAALQNQANMLLISIGSYIVAQQVTDELKARIIEPR